jgi:hypothetical protein
MTQLQQGLAVQKRGIVTQPARWELPVVVLVAIREALALDSAVTQAVPVPTNKQYLMLVHLT